MSVGSRKKSVAANQRARDSWCERFAKLPAKIARSSRLQPIDKLVWTVLTSHLFYGSGTRGIFPTLKQLADECGMEEERIEKSLRFLRYVYRDGWRKLSAPLVQEQAAAG